MSATNEMQQKHDALLIKDFNIKKGTKKPRESYADVVRRGVPLRDNVNDEAADDEEAAAAPQGYNSQADAVAVVQLQAIRGNTHEPIPPVALPSYARARARTVTSTTSLSHSPANASDGKHVQTLGKVLAA
jgi:N-methylhydantoinase A/oxoprolinase/acetone carboxylase beta subunit